MRELADFFILDRHHAVLQFDHGYLCPHGAVEAGELDANRARTHDEDGLGHNAWHHRLAVAPDQIPIAFEPGQVARARTGGQNNRFRFKLGDFLFIGTRHGHFAFTLERARTLEHRDFMLLHQKADAFFHLLAHPARTGDDFGNVECRILDADAVVRRVLNQMKYLRRTQQRFGRDATPVEANTAQMLALDQRHFFAQLA